MNDINYKSDEIKEKTIEQCKDLYVMSLLTEIKKLEEKNKELDSKIEKIKKLISENAD